MRIWCGRNLSSAHRAQFVIGRLEDWGIGGLKDLWIDTHNPPITQSANPPMAFGTGRRKRYRLRRTENASNAGGERRHRPRGQSFCGRRDCADAVQVRRRGRCCPQIRARQTERRDKLENMCGRNLAVALLSTWSRSARFFLFHGQDYV